MNQRFFKSIFKAFLTEKTEREPFEKQELFKKVANTLFLSISCFLIVYFLTQLTDNPLIKVGVAIFAIGLDIFLQWVLAYGRAKWKMGKWCKGEWQYRTQALFLFVIYAIYVGVYAGPSAIGFFSVEINAQEAAANKMEETDQMNRDRITQINETLAVLNQQLATEATTGYGKRSETIMNRVDKLTQERKKLQNTLVKVSKSSGKVPKNVFGSLAKVFSIPENILKVLIFGTSVLMLYLGLVLTSWNIQIEKPIETKDTNIPVKEIEEKVNKPQIIGIRTTIKSKEKEELLQYVDVAIRESKALNGNQRISELTGIPVERCIWLRDKLSRYEINGVPLIRTVQGASVANYPKEKIVEFIENLG